MPKFEFGFKSNPLTRPYRNKSIGESEHTDATSSLKAVSLFSGCGGLDLGALGGFNYLDDHFPSHPIQVIGAYDNDSQAVETYRLNIGDHVRECDLTTVDLSNLPSGDIVFGGFPCQDFSSCGPKSGFDGKRGMLFRVVSEYMRIHQPLIAIGENVPHIAKMKDGHYVRVISDDFADQGYRVQVWHLYCPDFGLPQNRERVFFVCVRNDLEDFPNQPDMTHFMRHRHIEDAIDDLKSCTDETVPNQSQYFVATKATKGAGQGDQTSIRGRVSYAVRANPKARVHFHYELPRRLTVRECARLQSFPDEFVFPHATGGNVMNIGNAVPPIIAHVVTRELLAYLRSQTKETHAKRGKRKQISKSLA